MNRLAINRLLLLSIIFFQAATAAKAELSEATRFVSELGLEESPIPSREMPGWSRPSKITVQLFRDIPTSGPGTADWFREATDGVEVEVLIPTDTRPDRFAESDVYVGVCNADALNDEGKLKYIHLLAAGIDPCMLIPGFKNLDVIATNSAKIYGDTMAEHTIALMLALTRNLHRYHKTQLDGEWRRTLDADAPASITVQGKTMLVLGLGGIGSQVARRAHELGMRVIATRNSSREGPDYVELVGLSHQTVGFAAQADVVVNSLPLTDATKGIADVGFFDAMKNNSYYISVGRGGTTDTDALVAALSSGKLAGAALDVTNPEPLPAEHRLWALPNVIITPHVSGDSDRGVQNMWILARENLRRYVRGEKLLNIVDLERGY